MKTLKLFITILALGCSTLCYSQTASERTQYQQALDDIMQMLEGTQAMSFKRAVFLTENAYYQGTLDEQSFNNSISQTADRLKDFIQRRGLSQYKTAGNYAAFSYLKEGSALNSFQVFRYNFEDFEGQKDWSNMFVSKLIDTKNGNCHSFPYLYKILCEEIGATAHLALGPNHVYIKHLDEQDNWANVELTNGGFPRDEWIKDQLKVTDVAIQKGTYMSPLSPRESIALTIFDLAYNYKQQFQEDVFYLSILDKALQYFPNCVPALMSKANYYITINKEEQEKPLPDVNIVADAEAQIQQLQQLLSDLGHQDLPYGPYIEWVKMIASEN